MATAAPQPETLDVVITAEEAETSKVYPRRPIATTIAAIAASYAEDVGQNAEDVVILSAEGRLLPPLTTLGDVGETYPSSGMVKLSPEHGLQVEVEVYRAGGARRTITVRPTSRPEELHPTVRRALNIDGERLFRLRTADSVLKYNLPLCDQGVGRSAVIAADLAFEVEVEDRWDGTVVNRLVYSSESCEDMLAEEESVLKSGGRTLDTSREVIDAFLGLGGPQLSLSLHAQKQLSVLDDRALRQLAVWPSDELRCVRPRRPGLTFEGAPLAEDRALSALDLPDHGLLLRRPSRLQIRLRSGKRRVLRLPSCATVGDVRAAARSEGETEAFSLTRGGEAVDENEDAGLAAVGAADDGPLEVTSPQNALVVRLRERSVRWSSEGAQRFGVIMARVAEETGILYQNLMARSLRCAGCGRRLWAEEEAAQAVPAACCAVRSLVLEEPPAPPAVANAETQTRRGQRSGPTSRTSVSVAPSTEERGVQACAPGRQAACQTEGTAREASGAQVVAPRRQFVAQHLPPLPLRPFLIHDLTGEGDREVRHDLRLADAPTIGAVRAAVAAAFGREPHRVKLVQFFAAGGAAVLVCDEDGQYVRPNNPRAQFGDASGRLLRREELKGWNVKALTDDDAPFLLVPGRRNWIHAQDR